MSASDSWASGAAYEFYMGRWSRAVARAFVPWLQVKPQAHWLEVGCGTGALTSTIVAHGQPASIVGCDPAEPFVAAARAQITDARASFLVANAEALPRRDGAFDAVVSALVLNFLPDPGRAVAAMRDRLGPGGVVAAYVWDYGEGLTFLRHFWDEATAADPRAATLDEGGRFPLCQPTALAALFREAGLQAVQTSALEIATDFSDFDDFWSPFLGGTGPAPSYVASLAPAQQQALKERLRRRLPDGPISLPARAWAVRGLGGQ
jgi:SAM-dependent methyltransferase